MTPKTDIVIKKTDADTGGILEGEQNSRYMNGKRVQEHTRKRNRVL